MTRPCSLHRRQDGGNGTVVPDGCTRTSCPHPPIEHVDTSRLLTRLFVAVTAATAAFFVYVGVLVPLIPKFIEDELGGSEFGIGLGVATFALAAIAVRPIITALIRGIGRRRVMVGGGLIAAAAGAIGGLAPSLPVFLALRAVMGIGEASLFVAAATLVADLAPPHRRAEASSYFSVAVFGGIAVGPIIGEAVLGDGRYALAFVVAAGFSEIAAVMSLRVPAHVHASTHRDRLEAGRRSCTAPRSVPAWCSVPASPPSSSSRRSFPTMPVRSASRVQGLCSPRTASCASYCASPVPGFPSGSGRARR